MGSGTRQEVAIKIFIFPVFLALCAVPPPASGQGSASGWRNLFNRSSRSEKAPAATSLSHYKGTVSVQPAGGTISKKIDLLPFPLHPGDQLRLGTDAGATIVFPDLSQVRLGPGSIFVIEDEESARLSLALTLGKIWVSVINGPQRSFQVRTPAAIAAVRGTRFSVEAAGEAGMVTEVYQGAVAVSALDHGAPAGAEALALVGQRIEVDEGVLREPRTMINAPPPAHSKPASKAEVEARLRGLLAKARADHEDDNIQFIEKALAEGEVGRMQTAADAADYSARISKKLLKALAKAFDGALPLSESSAAQPSPSRRNDAGRRDAVRHAARRE